MSPHPLLQVANGGERHLPVFDPEGSDHYRHMTAYHFARPRVGGRDVLDYGCGTGYGANFLARRGAVRSLVGVDVSSEAIAYCHAAYPDLGDVFRPVRPGRTPFSDESFDVILLFQVVEHVADDVSLLRELARLLRPGGELLLTTPNVVASGGDPLHPLNPHHVREYSRESLRVSCASAFSQIDEMGVHGSLRVGGGGLGIERSLSFRAVRKLVRLLVSPLYARPVSLADFTVRRRKLAQAVDLFFVCRRSLKQRSRVSS